MLILFEHPRDRTRVSEVGVVLPVVVFELFRFFLGLLVHLLYLLRFSPLAISLLSLFLLFKFQLGFSTLSLRPQLLDDLMLPRLEAGLNLRRFLRRVCLL